MANVFNNPYSNVTPRTWSLQSCAIQATASGGNSLKDGILAATQSVQVQYGRALNKRYPLASGTPITLVGVPQGTCTLTSIIGPDASVDAFLKLFGSSCDTFTLQIKTMSKKAQEQCEKTSLPQTLTLKGCQGQALNFNLSVQDNIVIAQGTFSLQFDTLDWSSK